MTKAAENHVCYVPTNLIPRAGGGLNGLILACLWSNPDINAAGVTDNAVPVLTQYCGMDAAAVDAGLRGLEARREVKIDWETGEALVPAWLEHNYLQERSVAESPADVLNAVDALKSSTLRQSLLVEIARLDVHYDSQSGMKT